LASNRKRIYKIFVKLSGKAKVKRQKAKVKTKQYRAPEQFLYLKTFTYLLSSLVNSGKLMGRVNHWGDRLIYYKRTLAALRFSGNRMGKRNRRKYNSS